MNNDIAFTKKQLRNWTRYEEVRAGGRWNMWDEAAQRATGLTRDDYIFTLRNYNALKKAVEK